jgi:hypothetical protein
MQSYYPTTYYPTQFKYGDLVVAKWEEDKSQALLKVETCFLIIGMNKQYSDYVGKTWPALYNPTSVQVVPRSDLPLFMDMIVGKEFFKLLKGK